MLRKLSSTRIAVLFTRPAPSSAYLFIMVALLLGLPLLTAYYNVNPSFYSSVLIPYLAATVILTIFLILRSQQPTRFPNSSGLSTEALPRTTAVNRRTSKIAKFNSLPVYFLSLPVAFTLAVFGVITVIVISTFPLVVPLSVLNPLATTYIVALALTSIIVFSKILYGGFSVLRTILQNRKYSFMALVFSIGFSVVYLLLVNQIIVSGYNVEGTAPSFLGYPSGFATTPGVNNILIYLVYLPTIIVQISPAINLIIIPFEVVFTTLLSLLVASNVVMAHYLISNSGLKCSTKGTALSTGGSILGLTATCPTCLVPAFVSVIFGGVTATVVSFSNFYGVVLPPVLSVASLVISLLYLTRLVRSRTNISTGLEERRQ